MSHDVQLSPAASHSPAATLPSSPSAEQSLRRQPAAADRRTEATGQARDIATSEIRVEQPHSRPCQDPRHRTGAVEPILTITPDSRLSSPPPGLSRRNAVPP